MKKNDLKSLVTTMHNELIEKINTQEKPTKEHVILFLQDTINSLTKIKKQKNDPLENINLSFSNHYKELTDESISYYQGSNERLDEIKKLQDEALEEFTSLYIDLPSISEKFEDIQEHMQNEISRANSIISTLLSKVKKLETNSNVDALTNVFNRRALITYLNNVCSKESTPHELHLLLLDIDDFKLVNDAHGHLAGDKILIYIANILKKTLRDGDKVFRYGGEEFVIILNRLSNDVCMQVTQRILKIISSNQLIYKGESLRVTMSIGATAYIQGDTPDTLINRADKALYKSKRGGKNQVHTEII